MNLELFKQDIKTILEYVDSCRGTGYNQEMSWEELTAYERLSGWVGFDE